MAIEFYDEYFALPLFDPEKKAYCCKDEYFRSKLENNRLYKYVAFDHNEFLNGKKLKMLRQEQFWASYYIFFRDKREVLRPYNCCKVSCKTGRNITELNHLFAMVNEMNDISCFTYKPSNFMWDEYSNGKNGFIMEFEMVDSDKFFPVIYLDKNEVDYTEDIIQSFSERDQQKKLKCYMKLAILPWVLKDSGFQKENEIRFLCGDIYDSEDGPMGGRIAPGKKKAMDYKGLEYSFNNAGISLTKVRIGSNCRKEQEIVQICKELNCVFDCIDD